VPVVLAITGLRPVASGALRRPVIGLRPTTHGATRRADRL